MTDHPQVILHAMCGKHERTIVRRLRLAESDPWRATLMVFQLLMFSVLSGDERVVAMCHYDPSKMNDAFAKVGCQACFDFQLFAQAIDLVKRRGLKYAANITNGKTKDDSWHGRNQH